MRPTFASAPKGLLWAAHISVWVVAGLAARLSRTGSQLEAHISGRDGAEIAPEHLRAILKAPTTEFKAISFVGAIAGLALSLALWKQSPQALGWLTIVIATACLLIYLAGYGLG